MLPVFFFVPTEPQASPPWGFFFGQSPGQSLGLRPGNLVDNLWGNFGTSGRGNLRLLKYLRYISIFNIYCVTFRIYLEPPLSLFRAHLHNLKVG